MKPDLSLLDRLHHGLCEAVERDGVVCFGKIRAKGLCVKHYWRLSKHGSCNLPKIKRKKCRFIDCNEVYYAKDLCHKHYRDHILRPNNKSKKCIAEGCNKKRSSDHRFCNTHYYRMRMYGDLNKTVEKTQYFKKGEIHNPSGSQRTHKACIVYGCDKTFHDEYLTRGLCHKHYVRWLRHGDYNIVNKRGVKSGQGKVCSIPGGSSKRDTSIQSHDAVPR